MSVSRLIENAERLAKQAELYGIKRTDDGEVYASLPSTAFVTDLAETMTGLLAEVRSLADCVAALQQERDEAVERLSHIKPMPDEWRQEVYAMQDVIGQARCYDDPLIRAAVAKYDKAHAARMDAMPALSSVPGQPAAEGTAK